MARSALRLLDRTFLLIFGGMALGLAVGAEGPWIGPAAVALLAAIMTLALATFDLGGLGRDARQAAWAPAITLGLLSTSFLLVGRLFPADTWGGWVLLAAAPPAISVIPYTAVLRGDLRLALAGNLLSYALAFLYLPLIPLLLLGSSVDLAPLIEAAAVLLLLPIVLSRPLRRARVTSLGLERARNVLFFAVYALVTAAIRRIVLEDPWAVGTVFLGTGVAMVAAFTVWNLASLRLPFSPATRTTYDLFASYKNQTLASALALVLLGPIAALPAILAGVFEAVWLVALGAFARRRRSSPSPQ